jgi:plasmid stabilization system protein ParE
MAKRVPPIGSKQLVIADSALADLRGITAYIAEDADPDTAARFADKLDAVLEKLARLGHAGVPRDEISPGLRLHVFGNYCIYFRVTATETHIVHVLNAARDTRTITFETD